MPAKRNKKEIYKDDFEEDLTDDEIKTLKKMIILGLISSPVDCGGCPGDAGCC